MATTLTSTLYPPQFSSTFAPAFPRSRKAWVCFSISNFNTSAEINRVHVSVVNQKSGENVVNNSTGILLKNLNYDADSGMYYVEIDGTATDGTGDIKGGWQIGQYYKVQLRFDKNASTTDYGTEAYFSKYSNMFSEWSQVLLLRPISDPVVHLLPFDTVEEGQLATFNPGILHISGSIEFEDAAETETMQSFTVQILDNVNETVLTEKEEVVTSGIGVNPNVIDYKVNLLNINAAEAYRLVLTVTTKNNYSFSKNYVFALGDFVIEDSFDPTVTLDLSLLDCGVVKLHLTNADVLSGGIVYVRRSSHLSNFKDWEVLEEVKAVGALDVEITDPTVGSGIFYRYAVQMENSVGGLTKTYYAYYIEEDDELQRKQYTIYPDFYDALLYRDGRQIGIRYNYKVSSVKPVVNRAKMDTIGGKYPKFVENAAMNYRQFSISGLISTQEDEEQMFLTKEEAFGDMLENFESYEENTYRDQFNIENYNYFWEREFRDTLVDWLNDGEPKLYRSQTEGTCVVILTDVNLTPNETLSRRLWDFSATMYEVAAGTSLEELETLGIHIRNLVKVTASSSGGEGGGSSVYTLVEKPGQVYRVLSPSTSSSESSLTRKGDVVDNIINYDLQLKYGGVYSTKVTSGLYLRNVKIQFLTRPSVYKTDGQNVSLLTDSQIQAIYNLANYSGTTAEKEAKRDEAVRKLRVGYAFKLDDTAAASDSTVFFVDERGYYQIPNSIQVQHLYILNPNDVCTVEYVLCYNQSDATGSRIMYTTLEKVVVAQYRGIFKYEQYLGDIIRKRHTFYADDYNQLMQWFKGISVEVDPYAVLQVRYENETGYTSFTIGETGVLHFLKNAEIRDLVFLGRRMNAVKPTHGELFTETEPWEFRECETPVEADDIETWHEIDGMDTHVKVRIFSDLAEYDKIGDGWRDFGNTNINEIVAEANRKAALADIENPQLQTVYKVQDTYYIYYKDHQFYKFIFDDDTHQTGVAQVPIQGYINYYGNVIKNHLG